MPRRVDLDRLEERCLLAGPGDMTPPLIIDTDAVTDARGKLVVGATLVASEPLVEAAAELEANYSVRLPGPDKRLGTGDDVARSPANADYDPAMNRITLTFATALKVGGLFRIVASAGPGGLADPAGNALDGDANGTAGGDYVVNLAIGASLKYNEADGDAVTLKLTGGDHIQLTQTPSDPAPRLEIINRSAATSTLTGSVKKARGGDGKASFLSITGDTLNNRLPAATFRVIPDTTAPAAPASVRLLASSDTGPSENDGITGDATPTVAGTAEIGSQVKLFSGGVQVGMATATDGTWQITASTILDGAYNFTATATDAAGNISLPSTPLPIVIDTAAPTVNHSLTGIFDDQFESFPLSFNESVTSAQDPNSYRLVVEGGPNSGQSIAVMGVEPEADGVRVRLGGFLANQAYRLTIGPAVTDLAGNRVSPATGFPFVVAQPTHLTVFDPAGAEEMVSPARDAIVRFDGPIDPATVNSNSFYLIANGERVPGTIRVSATERFATFMPTDPLPASTEIRVVVNGDRVMGRDGLPVDADGDRAPGGMGTADFRTLPLERIAGTEIFGYVYDSFNVMPRQTLPIAVPAGDPQFDPTGTGARTIPFSRAEFFGGTGTSTDDPRLFPNRVTSFIDASMVYGSDEVRARALRRLDGSGKLKTSAGDHLPINNAETFPGGPKDVMNMGPFPSSELPVAGDVRAAEVPTLAALHTLFVREHNRYAGELKAAQPRWTDEEIYQAARRWVGALIQHITYQEFLPAIVGPDPLPVYGGYQAGVDPSISALFSTAAFRLGHTLQSSSIQRLDASGQSLPGGPLVIRNAFFNPDPLREDGLDPYLRGLVSGRAQEADLHVIDDLRNFLFGPPGAGGLDLVSINIQRGRDMGLPGYNQARIDRGLPPVAGFSQISSNPATASALEAIYGDVNRVDVWVGGLAEDHVAGGIVGPLFAAIIQDQFQRSRDGDRFWYENGQFSASDLAALRGTTFAGVIERNSGVTGLPANVFTSGAIHAGPGPGGSDGNPAQVRTISGHGNNQADEHLGETHRPLRVDYTVGFGDGISTPGGGDRPNPRALSNALSAQAGPEPNAAGLTDMAIVWGQFLDHDLDLTPSQTAAGTNIPVIGATIRVDAFPDANAVTDRLGFFELEDMPAPEFFVHIDGTTATNAPAGTMYPSVGKPFHTVPGQRIQLSMAGMPFHVYLPPMAMGDVVPLEPNRPDGGTDVGFGAAGMSELAEMFPGLDPAVWDRLKVTYPAGSAIDDAGTPVEQAVVIPVPPDRLPAPLPLGADPRLVISVQAPGATQFDTPAPLSFPNLDGLAPGEQSLIYSFNHAAGRWEPIGTGTVTPDGLSIVSDPGVGIRAPGWHWQQPVDCLGSGGRAKGNAPRTRVEPPEVSVRFFATGDSDTISFTFNPPPALPPQNAPRGCISPPPQMDPVRTVTIKIDGPFDQFYDNTAADGLKPTSRPITLKPGDPPVTRSAKLMTLDQILRKNRPGIATPFIPYEEDQLFGAKITVEEVLTAPDGSSVKTTKIIAPYLIVDQSDDSGTDKIIKIPDTVITDDVTQTRAVTYRVSGAPVPDLVFEGAVAADFSSLIDIDFDPSAAGDRVAQMKVEVRIDGKTHRSSNGVQVQGKALNKQKLFINKAGLINVLRELSAGNDRYRMQINFADVDAAEMLTLSFDGSSVMVPYNATAVQIQNALAGLANVGAGNVVVRFVSTEPRTLTPPGGAGMPATRNTFEIEFIGDRDGTNLVLTGAAGGGTRIFGLTPHFTSAGITAEERKLFDNLEDDGVTPKPNERQEIADTVENLIRDVLFAEFGDGIEVSNVAGGDQTMSLRWTTTGETGLLGDSQPTPADNGVDNAGAIGNVVLTRMNHTPVVQNFLLDQEVNKSLRTNLDTYVNTPLELEDVTAEAEPVQALINTLAKTAAHEVGHTLSAYHTFRSDSGITVSIDGVAGTIDLMKQGIDFAGALRFREKLSTNVLRLALNLGWTFEDGRRAMANYVENYRLGPLDVAEGFGDIEHKDAPALDGALLAILDSSGRLAEQAIDVGPVLVDGPGGMRATRTLSLFNFGTQDVTLSSVAMSGTPSPFQVTAVPAGTVVAPGAELNLDVVFDPSMPGAVATSLVIRSNDSVMPEMHVDFSGFAVDPDPVFDLAVRSDGNNLGGVAVGGMATTTNFLTITNRGSANLVLTPALVAGVADFSLGLLDGVMQSLPFGASLVLPVTFAPSKLGLLSGLIRFTTNDPDRPAVNQGIVGSGIPAGGIGEGDFDWGKDFVAIDVAGLVQRTVSNAAGDFEVTAPTRRDFDVTIFDPVSGYVASSRGRSGRAGSFTDLTRSLAFEASMAPDRDFDGLPDDAEFAVGTSPVSRDTDGDGIDDFTAIRHGLDPLGGRGFPTGVIASVELRGQPQAIVVEGSLTDPEKQTAYLATGSYGLAIVDVSDFDNPIVLGQLDLPGDNALDVALDPRLGLAVVADGSVGISGNALHVIDVSDPMLPRLLRTIETPTNQVEVLDGNAFVAAETTLRVIELLTGDELQQVPLPGSGAATGMDIDGDKLYAFVLGGSSTLSTFDIDGFGVVTPLGQLPVNVSYPTVLAADDIVYLGGYTGGTPNGLVTVNVSNPAMPTLISGTDFQFDARSLALNGSGLILVGSEVSGRGVGVYDITDPTNTNDFLLQIPVPGLAAGLAIAGGIAFEASTGGFFGGRDPGLFVVNYLPFDVLGQAPTVTITAPVPDAEPGQPGVQVVEGSTIGVVAEIGDDVQVRNAELLVNGRVVRNDVSFPFDLSTVAPRLADGSSFVTLQVRATDTGGNTTLSDPIALQLIADAAGLDLVNIDPPNLASRTDLLSTVRARFSKPLDEATVTAGNFRILNSAGAEVVIRRLSLQASGRVVVLAFDALPPDTYRLAIRSSAVRDRVGNVLGTNDVLSSFTITRSVTISPNTADVDPGQPGHQSIEGTNFSVRITTASLPPGTFRSYELLVNGAVVQSANTSFFPPSVQIVVPDRAPGVTTAVVQLRATTATGTVVASNPLTLDLVVDSRPFLVSFTDPPDGAVRGRSLRTIDIRFSKRPDPNDVIPANFTILDEGNQPVALTDLTIEDSFSQPQDTVRLAFDALPEGEYRIVVKSASVTDRYGNPLGTTDFISRFSRRPVEISTIDVDPLPGVQVIEGRNTSVSVIQLDSLIETQAELLLDGQVVQSGATLPFAYSVDSPMLAPGVDSFSLQVRGTRDDTTAFQSNLLNLHLVHAIGLTILAADADPNTPGIQVVEFAPISLTVSRRVFETIDSAQLLVNGAVAQTDSNLPFVYNILAPPFEQSATATFQVRAMTEDGETRRSAVLGVGILNDSTPPAITSTTPANGAEAPLGLASARIVFSEPIALATVTPANFRLLDDGGNSVPLTNLAFEPFSNDQTVVLEFAELARGDYQISIAASAVTDRAGNPLGAMDVLSNFRVSADFIWVNPDGGLWTNPSNWIHNSVPGPTDDVIIASNGQVTVPDGTVINDLDLRAGTLVAGDFDINGEFLMSTGEVRGPGPFNINGTGRWTGGIIGVFMNPHTTRINGSLTLAGDMVTKIIDGRIMDNAGTVTWNESPANPLVLAIHAKNNAVWNNLPGSLFDAQVDGLFFGNDAGEEPAVFNNAGRIRKSAGTGTTALDLSVINTGSVEVQVGTLALETAVGESTSSSGAYTVAAGATLVLAGTQTLTDSSSVTGSGNVVLAGTTTINGAYNVQGGSRFDGGPPDIYSFDATPADLGQTVTLSSGQVRITGNYVQTAGETLNVTIGRLHGHDFGGSLVASGQAQLAGTLNVSLVPGYNPVVGDSFQILTYGSRTGQFATMNGLDLGGGRVLVAELRSKNLRLTVAAGPALRAAIEPVDLERAPALDSLALDDAVDAALELWARTGIDTRHALDDVDFRIADLPDDLLALTSDRVVWIDRDAAGFGWSVDVEGPVAGNRMDLVNAVAHELGHLLGLEHVDSQSHPGDVMADTLGSGPQNFNSRPNSRPARLAPPPWLNSRAI